MSLGLARLSLTHITNRFKALLRHRNSLPNHQTIANVTHIASHRLLYPYTYQEQTPTLRLTRLNRSRSPAKYTTMMLLQLLRARLNINRAGTLSMLVTGRR